MTSAAPNDRQVLDLSHDVRQIKALTGDHGEHFNRIVTEVELLGHGCELCGKVQDELQRLKNHSQDALGRLQGSLTDLQAKLDSGGQGCARSCSQLDQEVSLLRADVRSCTSRCQGKGQLSPDSFPHLKWQYAICIAVRGSNNMLRETLMVIFLQGQSHMSQCCWFVSGPFSLLVHVSACECPNPSPRPSPL